MKPHTRFSFCGGIGPLLVILLGFTPAAAIPQVLDPVKQGKATPEPSSVPPGPDEPDRRQPPRHDTNGAGEQELPASTAASICLLVESAAQAHELPLEFFARLIWQESRFKPGAVGPTTRNGQRAQGIAQFMPSTAKERGVLDPFDPVAALPKSAEFLQELHAQFGNLGLAAAAYNAGPRRLRDWLDGHDSLPGETRNYVLAITGRSVENWASAARGHEDPALVKRASCRELIAMMKEQPSPFVGELERHVREGTEQPWGVQLSAGFGREHVLTAYATLERSFRSLLENRDPIIIESKFRSRGTQTFYQVRVGADTRAGASELCGALKKAGGACIVLRNSMGTPKPL
jgi:Transglycosylase SLT domain/SPOR domain